MSRYFKVGIITLVCILVLASGCGVEKKDINDLHFILGAVFDYNPKTKLYEVHVQVARTGAFTKGDGGQKEENYIIYDGKGGTEFEAIRDMAKNGRRFFWGQCEVYIIGQELAKKGIFDLIDFLQRDNEIRENGFVLVSDAPTSKLLTIKNGDSKVPMQSILRVIRDGSAATGQTLAVRIREVFDSLLNENTSYLIPLIKIRESDFQAKEAHEKFHGTGAAIFKGEKIVATITPSQTRGYNFIKNQVIDTLINTKYQNIDIVIEEIKQQAKIKPQINNNELSILIEAKAWGNFAQVDQKLNLEDPQLIPQVEKAYSKKVEQEILDTINRAQELKADFLGFGRAVEKADPKLWESIKKDWQEEIFPEVAVDVKVEGTIIRTGLVITTKPEVTYDKRR